MERKIPMKLVDAHGELPLMAQFKEGKLDIKNMSQPVRMWTDVEKVIDFDEEKEMSETAEARKRKRKKSYERQLKSKLYIEDTPTEDKRGQKYEGVLEDNKIFSSEKTASKPNYVLLRVIRTPGASSSGSNPSSASNATELLSTVTEVHVEPVGEFYMFQKANLNQDRSLEQIDDEYDIKKEQDRSKQYNYRHLLFAGRAKSTDDIERERDEKESAADAAKRKRRMAARMRGDDGSDGEDGGLPRRPEPAFGFVERRKFSEKLGLAGKAKRGATIGANGERLGGDSDDEDARTSEGGRVHHYGDWDVEMCEGEDRSDDEDGVQKEAQHAAQLADDFLVGEDADDEVRSAPSRWIPMTVFIYPRPNIRSLAAQILFPLFYPLFSSIFSPTIYRSGGRWQRRWRGQR
jgi:hypothetical protein